MSCTNKEPDLAIGLLVQTRIGALLVEPLRHIEMML